MASKKQLVQSDMLALQGLAEPDLGYVAIGAKSNGFYIRIKGELEKKLADVNDLRQVIQSATLNSSGQLILTLYDNSEVNVGLVKGEDGRGIVNTIYDQNTGKITFTYSDSTTYVTEDLRAGTVKTVNNVAPDINGNVVINTGENVTSDAVNNALSDFTTGTPSESQYLTFIGKIKISLSNFKTLLGNTFVQKNDSILGSTKTKITYDSKGLVTSGTDLAESDIPTLSQSKITNLTSDLAGKSSTSHNHSGVYEPAISKSTGLLSWTGSAWAWIANNFLTSSSLKTVNGNNLVGSGDITISGGVTSVAGKTGVVTLVKNDITDFPTIPAAQVQSDWNAVSGMGVILNKPSVTPADNSITNAKLAQVSTGTIKGRKTAGTGNVEDLTAAEARAVIGVETDPIPMYCSDMTSDLTASTTVSKLRFMFEEARTLQSIVGSLATAATGSVLTVDIKKNGTSIFSTLLTFDAGENTTRTAATTAVLTGTISFAVGDYIDIYVTTVGSVTAGKGLLITLLTKR